MCSSRRRLQAYTHLVDTSNRERKGDLRAFAEEAILCSSAEADAVCSMLAQASELMEDGATSLKVCQDDAEDATQAENCVLPGYDRYGGNDTYLCIRKLLGSRGAFDFCMGNVVKLVDRWDKKGDPGQNLEKLRDYSAQALVEWRLCRGKLS